MKIKAVGNQYKADNDLLSVSGNGAPNLYHPYPTMSGINANQGGDHMIHSYRHEGIRIRVQVLLSRFFSLRKITVIIWGIAQSGLTSPTFRV